MKRAEGIVEILEAFDLTGSYRAAAELAGCSHHTVARYVRFRASGRVLTERATRDRLIDGCLAKVEEWVERSHGKVRADVVHEKLVAQGYAGSERTTRRAVARAKRAYAAGHRRVYRPWIPEPGMWLQFDWRSVGGAWRRSGFFMGSKWTVGVTISPVRGQQGPHFDHWHWSPGLAGSKLSTDFLLIEARIRLVYPPSHRRPEEIPSWT